MPGVRPPTHVAPGLATWRAVDRGSSHSPLCLLLDDSGLQALRFLGLLGSVDQSESLICPRFNQITLQFIHLLQCSGLKLIAVVLVLFVDGVYGILVLLDHAELPELVQNPDLILFLLELVQLVLLLLHLFEFKELQLLHFLFETLDLSGVL